jgi:predicted  nucleic acid-binding Zn-ribbon protein
MALHSCAECGLPHDAVVAEERESEQYRLAKLESETRIKLAQIERSSVRLDVEAAVEVAEVQAEAEVEAAAVEGEIISAALEASDVEAEPIEIVAPDMVTDVDIDNQLEDAPPETDGSPVPEASKPRGLGMW